MRPRTAPVEHHRHDASGVVKQKHVPLLVSMLATCSVRVSATAYIACVPGALSLAAASDMAR